MSDPVSGLVLASDSASGWVSDSVLLLVMVMDSASDSALLSVMVMDSGWVSLSVMETVLQQECYWCSSTRIK